MITVTLTIIEGDAGPDANGVDLADAGISYTALPAPTIAWLEENRFDVEHPDRWILVTDGGEDPNAVNVIASREISLSAPAGVASAGTSALRSMFGHPDA